MYSLIKLTENDKRLIIVLLLVFILFFVIVGYIYLLVKKIMKSQGSKADALLKNVVDANYFNSESKLRKFGRKKNINLFFKEAKIPFIILVFAWLLLLLYCLFSKNWHVNLFDYEKTGIRTLFYVFDWSDKNLYTTKVFGITLLSNWPPVISKPHFVWSAWISYLFIPLNIVGGVWFLICTQAYIARSWRIYKIAKGIFRKKLVPEETPAPANQDQQN